MDTETTSSPPDSRPLALHAETVLPEWIDYNGHMNVAFYLLTFDHASDAVLDRLGLGITYRERTDCSIFVAEAHITYEREVNLGDRLTFTTQVLGGDDKRLHLFHRMYLDADEVPLVATNELMMLHVDLGTRRTAPFPDDVRALVGDLITAHAALDRPHQAGRVIAVKARPAA